MKTILRLLPLSLCLSLSAFADDAVLQFSPDPYELGEIEQGAVKHVKLGGANLSKTTVEIESAMCQGVGCSNFKFTKVVKPRQPVSVEFDLNTATMEGEIANLVILVGKDGKTYTTQIGGAVKAPFVFSEKMFDAGYYAPGEKREWSFYVWSADGKTLPDFELPKASAGEFSASFKKVSLDVASPDDIKEGGGVPGIKVTLKTAGLVRDPARKQKSLSKIVPFTSKSRPKATPEVLVIGYWK